MQPNNMYNNYNSQYQQQPYQSPQQPQQPGAPQPYMPPSQQPANGQYNSHQPPPSSYNSPPGQYNAPSQYSSPALPPPSQHNRQPSNAPPLPYAAPPTGPPSPHRYPSAASQHSQYSNGQSAQHAYSNGPSVTPSPMPSGPYPAPPLASLHQQQQQQPYNQYNNAQQPSFDQQMGSMSLQQSPQQPYGQQPQSYAQSSQPGYPLPSKGGASLPPANQSSSNQAVPQQPQYGGQQPNQQFAGQHYGGGQQQQLNSYPVAPHWVVPVHPKYFSTTCAGVPANTQLRLSTCIPFGGIVRPLNDDVGTHNSQLPVAVFGAENVVRCKDCRIYMNPYVQFINQGHQWRCNVCGLTNDTPQQYYSPLDGEGKRVDTSQRVELTHACHEIQAPADYMVRQPMPPVFYFVIDVSRTAQDNGSLHTVCSTILQSLSQLPGDKRTMLGFMTFDSTVHYYTFNSAHEQPQMYVVSELEELFIPTPADVLTNLDECRSQIEAFLNALPTMFVHTSDVESCTGSAIESAIMAMSRIGGRMCVFMSSLPSIGLGRLNNRDNQRLMNTDKEHTLIQPATDFYKKLTLKLVRHQIVCDIFLLAGTDAYMDIGTVGETARFSAGEVYYYSNYSNETHGSKLQHELHRALVREQSWESVIRVRASKGVTVTNFHGNFFLRNPDLLATPGTDGDKTFTFELRSEAADAQIQSDRIIVQSALLYTTSQGERRIRVQTLCLPVMRTAVDLFNAVNVNGVVNLISKEAVQLCWLHGFDKARKHIMDTCVSMMRAFNTTVRPEQAQQAQAVLQVLPIMSLGLIKSTAFVQTTEHLRTDMRAYSLMRLCTMSMVDTETYVRPRLLRVDQTTLTGEVGVSVSTGSSEAKAVDMSVKSFDTFADLPVNTVVPLPAELQLTAESVTPDSVLLIDNGMEIIIRLGEHCSQDFLYGVLGVSSASQVDTRHPQWQPVQPNDTTSLNARFHAVIAQLRATAVSGQYQSIVVCKQGEPSDMKFLNGLIEDRQQGTSNMGLRDLMNIIYGQQRR